MNIRYPATVEQQGELFFVQFQDFDNVFTEGETLEDALLNASEALSGMLGWMMDNGKKIPQPGKGAPGAHLIAPDAKTQAALLVRFARGKRSLSVLARALQTS